MKEEKQKEIVYDDDYIIKSTPEKKPKKEAKKEPKEEKAEKPVKKEKNQPKKNKKKKKERTEKKDKTLTYISILAIILIFAILFKTGKISLPDRGPGTPVDLAATVNGDEISVMQIDNIYNRVPDQLKLVYTKEKLLDQEIINLLIVQKAKEEGITIEDSEIDTAMDELKLNIGGDEALKTTLDEYGMTEANLKNDLARDLLIKKFLEEVVTSEITISDDEVEEYYINNLEQFQTPEMISARHILICFDEIPSCEVNRTREEAFALFKKIVTELDGGKDFSEAAKEYSDGPSAQKGGDLGKFPRGTMVQTFENMAFSLDVGEYNRIATETMYGFHIIQVYDKQDAGTAVLDEVRDAIEQELLLTKQGPVVEEYIAGLKENADIEKFMGESTGCYSDYDLSADTVIYLGSDEDWCVHCETMDPIVLELKDNGANLISVDYAEEDSVVTNCFKATLEKGAPQFICAGSGETKVGTLSSSKLKTFVENCK